MVLAAVIFGGSGGTAAAAPAPAVTPAPTPPLTCPPVLPISGVASGATTDSVTISYYLFLSPPCGYNPPITVTLFAGADNARQWTDPVAEAVSGPERSGQVTIGDLAPDTQYWFRFTADGKRDPYVVGSARTTALACTATLTVSSAWTGGAVATVAVRNIGPDTLSTWRVSWRWSGDERITSLWNGVTTNGADGVTVANASWNGTLAPGATTTFGLLVDTSAPLGAITPTCTR
ncbi:cellulose binding domain-containing protein [Actinoplanes bogorensis]|uniref:Cellulose binding domain-containing protein n=2 Tax=Paractinoplanes bogorensis TaxID=1610840 RepID=A0ABS5YYH7_9ACTN|nr:cellulose binding domain-containing protein [Actinoplanes bogorensis]